MKASEIFDLVIAATPVLNDLVRLGVEIAKDGGEDVPEQYKRTQESLDRLKAEADAAMQGS